MIRAVRADGTIETGGAFAPIRRPRLMERLAGAAMQRVVLLIAPAGYGKSVALRQFLNDRENTVRFDVQSDHGTLLGFLRGFSEAIAPIAPQARDTLAGAYDANSSSANAGTDLALWMHSHIRGFRGTVAIDDLHVAQEDREVTRFVSSLIERTKDRVQWIIASRATTGLPIGTWLAYGESDLAVDEHDLRFTPEEARDAARAFRLAVRDEELLELLQLTDGWATAMSFALRTSTRSVDIRSISATTREMIFHYLAEQVYASLSDQERRFLEVATQLQRIDIRLLVAAGFNDAAALIDRLQARVAFLHQEESSPGIYRCHDLFRDFIARQVELQGHAYASELRTSVANVLLEHGMVRQALALFMAANVPARVEAILRDHAIDLIARGNADIVQAALQGIAETTSPEIVAARGLLAAAQGRFEEAERLLTLARRNATDSRLRADAGLRLAKLRVNRHLPAQEILNQIIAEEDVPYEQKLDATSLLAIASLRDGAPDISRNYVAFVESRISSVASRELQARLSQRLGLALLELQEYDRAGRHLKFAAETASDLGLWGLAANAFQVNSAHALFAVNDTAAALWMAQQAANAAEKAGDVADVIVAQLSMLSIETRRGNSERAVEIERFVTSLRSSDTTTVPYIASSQAHRAAWTGDFATAHRLFASVLDRQHSPQDRAFTRAAYALCLAFDGRSSESQKAVDSFMSLIENVELFPETMDSVQVEAGRLLCVLAEALSGRHTRAQRLMKYSSRSAHPVARRLLAITEQLVRWAKTPSYVPDGLLADFESISSMGYGIYPRYLSHVEHRIATSHQPAQVEIKLTAQEVRIIRLVADGLAPKDIAIELGRSVYTIQTHIQNVIEKLGCHGRSEAVAAARRLGVI